MDGKAKKVTLLLYVYQKFRYMDGHLLTRILSNMDFCISGWETSNQSKQNEGCNTHLFRVVFIFKYWFYALHHCRFISSYASFVICFSGYKKRRLLCMKTHVLCIWFVLIRQSFCRLPSLLQHGLLLLWYVPSVMYINSTMVVYGCLATISFSRFILTIVFSMDLFAGLQP
jgi:hypothetical protein